MELPSANAVCFGDIPTDIIGRILGHITAFKDVATVCLVSKRFHAASAEGSRHRRHLSLAGALHWDVERLRNFIITTLQSSCLTLDMWGCTFVTATSLRIIPDFVLRDLKKLCLWGCTNLMDQDIADLMIRTPKLTDLNLGGTRASVRTLRACTMSCPKLRVLSLAFCRHLSESLAESPVNTKDECPFHALASKTELSSLNVVGVLLNGTSARHLLEANVETRRF
ncbi:hypothetical protein CYMTET_53698 [Cymbomonas tetramitiformis]|uniref:F-box domain-containing protein n=1 Tax=Cymbomonas tetramitiformis TaxID=36881 RepID=A0AAE0BHV8_9CHLO|nr:hypothetical protein CYMTET_53698 [Cymbomonas tetramitiformis]